MPQLGASFGSPVTASLQSAEDVAEKDQLAQLGPGVRRTPHVDLAEQIIELRGHPMNVADDNGQHLGRRVGLHAAGHMLRAPNENETGSKTDPEIHLLHPTEVTPPDGALESTSMTLMELAR